MKNPPLIEAVCCSVEDALAAEQAGAGRIELCSAIELGGLTPSFGLVREVKKRCKLPAVAMVRPRPSGFAYTESELAVMADDAASLMAAGIDGLVLAALTAEGQIDVEACRTILSRVETSGLQTVFHRAFDATPDLFRSLEVLIDLGFTRILTSGGAPTAIEGTDVLAQLVDQAAGRIEILPAGGVRACNAAEILRRSGASQLHLGPMRDVGDPTAPFYGATHKALDGFAVAEVVQASLAAV